MVPTLNNPYPERKRRQNPLTRRGVSVRAATKRQFQWLCFLILACCYELPIWQLTSFHRVNPRLVDVAAILGILFIYPSLRYVPQRSEIFRIWSRLVYWFAFCAVLWAVAWLPWGEAGKFSIFYAIKYLEGVGLVYLVLRIPLSPKQKRFLHYCVIAGGVVVTLFAIPEYMQGGTSRAITEDKVVHFAPGVLFSCLGPVYGHVSGVSTLACCMTLSLLITAKQDVHRWGIMLLSGIVAWPALVCGSRSGLLSIFLAYGLCFIFVDRIRVYLVSLAAIGIICLSSGVVELPNSQKLKESSRSVARLLDTESKGAGNTIMNRILFGQAYDLSLYRWQGIRLPLFGGGFYAVPHSHGNHLKYRIGYGIHCGYLFPLEQGGIVAFVLFLSFLAACIKQLKNRMKSRVPEDAAFVSGMFVFFIILMLRSWTGSPFWHGNGMENFSTFVLLMLTFAALPSQINSSSKHNK